MATSGEALGRREQEIRRALRALQAALAGAAGEDRRRMAERAGELARELGEVHLRQAQTAVPEAFRRAFADESGHPGAQG